MAQWLRLHPLAGGIRMGNTCKSMADSCQCMAKTTTIKKKKIYSLKKKKKTPPFQCRGQRLIPGWGTKILQAVWFGQEIKK